MRFSSIKGQHMTAQTAVAQQVAAATAAVDADGAAELGRLVIGNCIAHVGPQRNERKH
jgi:hypothetical protein